MPDGWFCALLDTAPDVYFRYALVPSRRFAYVSPAVQTLTGRSPADFYTDAGLCLSLIAGEDRRRLRQVLRSRRGVAMRLQRLAALMVEVHDLLHRVLPPEIGRGRQDAESSVPSYAAWSVSAVRNAVATNLEHSDEISATSCGRGRHCFASVERDRRCRGAIPITRCGNGRSGFDDERHHGPRTPRWRDAR